MTNSDETLSGQNSSRWGASTWLLAVAVIAVTGAAFLGWFGKWERGVPADAVKAGEVAADGVRYYGKPIKTYGVVSRSLMPRFFVISDSIQGTADLPVVLREAGAPVELGDTVIVEGIPTAFDAGRIRQDYGIQIPEEPTWGWRDRPIVLASKIRKLK